ncbi:hypothetical protein [Stenotrophomonas sp. PS02289]|uniref:hypothetical protein n=1 Tax=Stenotrophomonas sp. PS02289 TaxID=2991422 RepID=UPI00249A8240|nr:hypothetical protein [Stenotrophomonas sp. PS02289]
MIEELKGYWPIIVQYPWAFLWAAFLGATAGWYAHSAWRAMTRRATEAKRPKDGVWKQLGSVARKRLFFPSSIQTDCIRGLRLVDHKELTVGELAELLALPEMDSSTYPQSDVEQALQALQRVGWVRTGWNHDLAQTYSLAGGGLDYARKRGYLVLPIKHQ